MVLDLENFDIKIDDEDKVIILLNSLPKSLKHFKKTLKYERQTILVEEVQNALNSKIWHMKSNEKNNNGENLNVKGRSQKKEANGRSKS